MDSNGFMVAWKASLNTNSLIPKLNTNDGSSEGIILDKPSEVNVDRKHNASNTFQYRILKRYHILCGM